MNKIVHELHKNYRECYVAFLDILGMKNMTEEGSEEIISKIAMALGEAMLLDSTPIRYATLSVSGKDDVPLCWKTQIRAFSDNVVLFIPTQSNRFNDILRRIGYLHDKFLFLGLFTRGAVTISKMYWDDQWCCSSADKEKKGTIISSQSFFEQIPITFGPGLVEAYRLESTIAIYPRIIFSAELMKYIKDNIEESFFPNTETLKDGSYITFANISGYRDILQYLPLDFDGVAFLDMFNCNLERIKWELFFKDEPGVHTINATVNKISHGDYMESIRPYLDKTVSSNPKIRAKHAWLINRFNLSLPSDSKVRPINVNLDYATNEYNIH